LQLLLFVRGNTIEGAQRVLDALHGADGIAGVYVRGVDSRAPDEKGRHGRGWLALLRISNPLKGVVLPEGVIVEAHSVALSNMV